MQFFLCPLDPGFPLSYILLLREYPCRGLAGVAMAVGIVEWGRVQVSRLHLCMTQVQDGRRGEGTLILAYSIESRSLETPETR